MPVNPTGTFKEGDADAQGGDFNEKSVIPTKFDTVVMAANDTQGPVYDVTQLRGIGLNFPAMVADTLFSVYVSPNKISLGETDSLMAILDDVTFQALLANRTAFSSSFIAEHRYFQLVPDVTQIAYEFVMSGS